MSALKIWKGRELITEKTVDSTEASYFSHGHCVSANDILSNAELYKFNLDFTDRVFVEAVAE